MSAIRFIGNFEVTCHAWIQYRSNYTEEEIEVCEFVPTQDKPHLWNYLDTMSLIQQYGQFSASVSLKCCYAPEKISFKKFISDIHFLQELNESLTKDISYAGSICIMMKLPDCGWYQLTGFSTYKENFANFYKYLYGDDSASEKSVADTIYNEGVIKDIVRRFWEKNSDMVESWSVQRVFYNPEKYPNRAYVTLKQRNIILIDLVCHVEQPDELKTCFYTRILEALKSVFNEIPKIVRHEYVILVRITSKDKYMIPQSARANDTKPIPGYADGYTYVINQNGINFKSILVYDDIASKAGETMCVVMFTNGKGKLMHRAKITYPAAFKWL